MQSELIIKKPLWLNLVDDLKHRGQGKRESGAFLLGAVNTIEITHHLCYDDLDPQCLDTGIIEFNGACYSKLWKYCREHALSVIADVHTHPGAWTGQSEADRTHPMISQTGHIAFIMPNYAQKRKTSLKGVSAYCYLGAYKWSKFENINHAIKIA